MQRNFVILIVVLIALFVYARLNRYVPIQGGDRMFIFDRWTCQFRYATPPSSN